MLPGATRRVWWQANQRERLVERVARFVHPTASEIWVVFDGDDPAGSREGQPSRVRTVFAPSADDWLVRRVRSAAIPADRAVVTADRQVAGRSLQGGASVVAPREFLEHCL